MRPHSDRNCRSNFLTHPVTVYDTGPISPSPDPITPGAWQDSHWSANFQVTGMTRSARPTAQAGIELRIFRSRGGRLNHDRPTRWDWGWIATGISVFNSLVWLGLGLRVTNPGSLALEVEILLLGHLGGHHKRVIQLVSS